MSTPFGFIKAQWVDISRGESGQRKGANVGA